MNRKILFRGKNLNNSEWVYGGFVQYDNKSYIIIFDRYIPDTRDWDEAEYYENNPHFESQLIEVDFSTVGQYVGINDNNNTKIFEGDILKVSWNVDGREPAIAVFVCEYHKSAFLCRRLNSKNIVGTLSNYVSIKKNKNVFISCEVVGNIIDNPEISVCL